MPNFSKITPAKIAPSESASSRYDGFFKYTLPNNFTADESGKLNIYSDTPAGWMANYPPDREFANFWKDKENGYLSKDTTYYLHPTIEPAAIFAYAGEEKGLYPIGTSVIQTKYSMTEEHYAYIRAVHAETEWRGIGPFDIIPANVPTNLSNGALGFFSASAVTRLEQKMGE